MRSHIKTNVVRGLLMLASFAAGTAVQLASAEVPSASSGQREDTAAQVTLGGAQYFVEGDIAKIDAEYYFVRKDETGEQIRLIVNADTNLNCAAMPESRTRQEGKSGQSETMTSERIDPKGQAPLASEQQLQQGQRKDETARGAGFRIGRCAFQMGDHVKAEVDDNGRVTTLKYLAGVPQSSPRSTGPSAGTGQLAIPGEQDKPAQLDIAGGQGFPPKEYAVVPLRIGKLRSAEESPFMSRPVVDLHGKQVGTIDKLLVDTGTGRIEYAVILVAHTAHHLHPIPWAAIKLKADSKGNMTAVLDTDNYKVHPDTTMEETVDLSPSVKTMVKKMETLRMQADKTPRARIEITMKDHKFQVKGHSTPGSLTEIVLRNEDTETHGLTSSLFKDVKVDEKGEAVRVNEHGMRAYHLSPGKTAMLSFTKASQADPSTGIRETSRYMFSCDIHPNMKAEKAEILVVETMGETGGG